MTTDAHRASEVETLTRLIEKAPSVGPTVISISGPGGVGKTFLLNHVLQAIEAEKRYLVLRADGSNADTRNDFFGLINGQLFRRSLPAPADDKLDYFPRLREITRLHRELIEKAMKEIEKQGAPENVKRAAKVLLTAGRVLNPKKAKLASRLQSKDVDLGLDAAWDLVKGLKGLRESTYLPGPIRDLIGVTRRNRIKSDLYSLTASELRVDLAAALVGYEKKDASKMTHRRIPGVEKLILILDDYEAIHELVEDFLVGALIQELASAPFQSLLIVLCRDDLQSTHPGWAQHCSRYLADPIRLCPFSEKAAAAWLQESGIPESRWQTIFLATHGYPFLLSLVIEEAAEQGDSVVFLRRFYDRTTRWMTETQKGWFLRTCYLDFVNEDTLSLIFPDASDAEISQIQDWFESEASIRDPDASHFRVRPLIREKMLRYQEVRSPSRHKETVVIAANANPGSQVSQSKTSVKSRKTRTPGKSDTNRPKQDKPTPPQTLG